MFYKQYFICFISCCLSSCASQVEAPSDANSGAASSRSNCILEGTIRDYRILDERNLLVTASGQRKYHFELSRAAFGLRSTRRIGISSTGSRVCPGFSEVIVHDSLGPETVRIDSIRRLNPDEYEDILIRFGKKEPDIERPRKPVAVKGAEVEELD